MLVTCSIRLTRTLPIVALVQMTFSRRLKSVARIKWCRKAPWAMEPHSSVANVRSVRQANAPAAVCPDILDRRVFLARQAHPVFLASLVAPANLDAHRLCVTKCQFHHARHAHLVHQDHPDLMASQAHQDSPVRLVDQEMLDHPETQDHKDHPDHPEAQAKTELEASQASQPSAHPIFPESLERLAMLDHPEHPVMLAHLAEMATQDNKDHPDQWVNPEPQEPMESQAHPVPKDHLAQPESQECAPSIAPLTVVSSTRMARSERHKHDEWNNRFELNLLNPSNCHMKIILSRSE